MPDQMLAFCSRSGFFSLVTPPVKHGCYNSKTNYKRARKFGGFSVIFQEFVFKIGPKNVIFKVFRAFFLKRFLPKGLRSITKAGEGCGFVIKHWYYN
jgi:hypothetical protein